MTSDEATEIMTCAQSDPERFNALLVGPTSIRQQQDAAADVLNAWLAPAASPLIEVDAD